MIARYPRLLSALICARTRNKIIKAHLLCIKNSLQLLIKAVVLEFDI